MTNLNAAETDIGGGAKVYVTFFKNAAADSLTTDTLTLTDLRERVLSAAKREKDKLPWLKLASFGKHRSARGSLRHDANVVAITGLEVDYDEEKITFDDAVAAIKAIRICALVYTSPSHSAAAPRWRIVVPTSQPHPPHARAKLVARLNGFLKAQLGSQTVAASESFVLSQAYFFGYVMNKPGLDHRAEVVGGDYIDLRDDLARFEPSGANTGSDVSGDETDPYSDYSQRDGIKRGKTDDELVALLKQSRVTAGKGWREPMLRFIGSTVGKGWSDLAIKLACAPYSDGGVDDRDIQELINRTRTSFGKPEPKLAENGDACGTAQQIAVDPVDLWGNFNPPSLPRGLLPDVIERFAHDQGMDMGADMSGIAMSALAVCAAAIPDSVQLQVKRHSTGWKEPARLWVALVGSPSSKKSPIMATAARPLRKIDADQARDYADQRAVYDKLPKEEKLNTNPPKQVRSILQDTTIEAAQDILKDSPDGLLCYQDELSGWFGAMDKYSPGRGSAKDRSFWLEAFNGGNYSVQRVGRGAVFIENLSISLIGGIQPEPIRQIANDSVDDGLLQRLLPILLTPAVAGRDEVASPVVAEYETLVRHLNCLANMTLRFDDGAQCYRQELELKHLELQSLECVHRKLAAHIGKYDGIFARLCVIWHCIENMVGFGDVPPVITEATAKRVGAFLHGFLLPHAMAFYTTVLGYSNDHDRLTAVAGYILSHGLTKITNRDLMRGDRAMRRLAPEEGLAIFERLEAFGWLERGSSQVRGAPARWLVNPTVHEKFAERAKAEAARRAEARQTIVNALGKGDIET
ncbi:DUF3987 domain-containing protein [Bradyrhizobium sp. 14AA]